jgi:hypothetical protein
MKSTGQRPGAIKKADGEDTVWRRWMARFVRGLSDLLEASEPKRKRPRNLYISGMTSQRLVTRPYSE